MLNFQKKFKWSQFLNFGRLIRWLAHCASPPHLHTNSCFNNNLNLDNCFYAPIFFTRNTKLFKKCVLMSTKVLRIWETQILYIIHVTRAGGSDYYICVRSLHQRPEFWYNNYPWAYLITSFWFFAYHISLRLSCTIFA